jgi:hypothetical protein
LFDEPVNLPFGPFFLISRIYDNVFSLMMESVIRLSYYDSIAVWTTSLLVNSGVAFQFLSSIHNDAVSDRKLSIVGSATIFHERDQLEGYTRFS